MNKYSTCLTPFMFHLLSSLANGSLTECAGDKHNHSEAENVSKDSVLKKRKKTLLKETIEFLSLNDEEKDSFLNDRTNSRPSPCGLCLVCIGCEHKYWEEVNKLIGKDHDQSEHHLPKEINELLLPKEKPEEIYVKNYLLTRQLNEYRNKLVMLKGFSSSTPFLLNHSLNTNHYSGGGFYLNWYGLGIAVDPGYHFVQNLHQNGLNVLDIDVVIITHEHIDHNSDMRLLDDLHYNASKVFQDDIWTWDERNWNICQDKDSRHIIRWYMDEVTYSMVELLQKKGSGFAAECNELHCIQFECDKISYIDLCQNVQLQVFQTKHEQLRSDPKSFWPHTFGCSFLCKQRDGAYRKIGYTSDTSFHPDIIESMCSVLENCDIIIENISGIYKDDVLLKIMKERHLGYHGCYKLIEKLYEKSENKIHYILLSEFSNLITDIRFDIAKYMQDNIHKNIDADVNVYPTEVGMVIDLDSFLIRCSECHEYAQQPIIVRQEEENMPLRYCCEKCTYGSESKNEYSKKIEIEALQ